jgi:hypothetical protein
LNDFKGQGTGCHQPGGRAPVLPLQRILIMIVATRTSVFMPFCFFSGTVHSLDGLSSHIFSSSVRSNLLASAVLAQLCVL